MPYIYLSIDRGRCLKVEGSNWGDALLRPRARPKAMLGWVQDGVAPSCNGSPGVSPRKFLDFMYKMGHLGSKLQVYFDSKHSAILTQTFSHKWFSEDA